MSALKTMIGTIIGVAMVVGFTTLILALVLSLASEQLPQIKTLGEELRCLLNIPAPGSACVARKVAALDDRRRALEEAKQHLQDVMAEQKLVFTQGDKLKDHIYLLVGTLYEYPAARTGVIGSFCWASLDISGIDKRVGLAVMDGDGRTENLPIGAADLALLGISAGEADAARDDCEFPRLS